MADSVLRDLTATGSLAHAAVAALVCADLWWRSERVRVMLRGVGSPVSLRHAMALTAFGDAAALMTPWRAGGEVGRMIGARAAGVSLPVSAAILSVELVMAYVLAAFVGTYLATSFGGAWWSAVQTTGAGGAFPLRAAIVGAATIVAVLAIAAALPAVRRRIVAAAHAVGKTIIAALATMRRIPANALAAGIGLSLLSLGARVAVLPLLALATPDAPPVGVLALASFTLLYAQVAMPTPAGGGAIELAFLGGGLGIADGGSLLGWWRLYMTILPMIGGIAFGVLVYGKPALRAVSLAAQRKEFNAA